MHYDLENICDGYIARDFKIIRFTENVREEIVYGFANKTVLVFRFPNYTVGVLT